MQNFLVEAALHQQEFVALDLETTGLLPEKHEIVEIAAVRFTREKVISEFNELIKPIREIPEEATKINGITNADLESARSILEVLPIFLDYIENSILVIQNSIFDLSFLMHASKMQRLDFPNLPVFCTLQMTRKLFPAFKKYNLVALRGRFQIEKKWYRTQKGEEFHEALDDTHATAEVLKNCLNLNNHWNKTFKEVVIHEKNLKFSKDYDNYLI